ncbi:MAG TPA: hypothetical protein VK630_08840, partial [Reyranella sp.]|nr:hypothetical protein [Reyranella sp.]
MSISFGWDGKRFWPRSGQNAVPSPHRRSRRTRIDIAHADGNRMIDYRQAIDRLNILDVLQDC